MKRLGSILAAMAIALLAPAATARQLPDQTQRHAILEALRHSGDHPDRRFVVHTLRVASTWAWVLADPQSADGKQHYETEAALLHRIATGWAVVDQPCSEEACDWMSELARIRRSHPAAPATLFHP